MIKNLILIIVFIFFSNCSLKKVVKHHGVPFLEKKQKLLIVNETNTNEIKKVLGYPSTISNFDNNVWIYIERKQTQSELKNLGRMKIYENNILVLEIDEYGIIREKNFYNIDDMNDVKLAKEITQSKFKKKTFIYDFLSSMRQKINDPLGQRAKKRKESTQR
jgi:outer membrane protein assembly factor BamE (lipoprotein component of BamABCDE complex)